MKTEYIDTLYQDFNRKVEAIFRYIDLLKNNTTKTTEFLAQYVALHEQLHDTLSQSKQQNVLPTDTQFAVEQNTQVIPNNDNIKELSSKINNSSPMIEYKFEELLRNLQYISQSFQSYQEMTNKILEAWNESIQGIQQ